MAHRKAFGENNGNAKLNDSIVAKIRSTYGLSHGQIAIKYGVSRPTVSDVINVRTWKHF